MPERNQRRSDRNRLPIPWATVSKRMHAGYVMSVALLGYVYLGALSRDGRRKSCAGRMQRKCLLKGFMLESVDRPGSLTSPHVPSFPAPSHLLPDCHCNPLPPSRHQTPDLPSPVLCWPLPPRRWGSPLKLLVFSDPGISYPSPPFVIPLPTSLLVPPPPPRGWEHTGHQGSRPAVGCLSRQHATAASQFPLTAIPFMPVPCAQGARSPGGPIPVHGGPPPATEATPRNDPAHTPRAQHRRVAGRAAHTPHTHSLHFVYPWPPDRVVGGRVVRLCLALRGCGSPWAPQAHWTGRTSPKPKAPPGVGLRETVTLVTTKRGL